MAGKTPTRRVTEPALDARLARLERGLHDRLPAEMRRRVLRGIEWVDRAWAKARREFPMPGQTAPDFHFRPTPLTPRKRRTNG